MSAAVDRLVETLLNHGDALEAQAVGAVVRLYAGLDLANLVALLSAATALESPLARAEQMDALLLAWDAAAAQLGQPPEALAQAVRAAVEAGVEGTAAMFAASQQVLDAFTVPPIYQMQWAQHSERRMREFWGNEPVRLHQEIASAIRQGLERGQSIDQITRRIQERSGVSRSRAALIARDQVSSAAAFAMQESQRLAGVESYIWRTARDRRVRDTHRERDGKEYRWDKPPPDGHPGESIQCRCIALAVIPEGGITSSKGPQNEPVPPDDLKLEQMQEGKHALSIQTGDFSKSQARTVLRGATKARLTDFLAQHPLSEVRFAEIIPRTTGGMYNPATQTLTVNTRRAASTYGSDAVPGAVTAVSAWGRTREEAMQMSFVHELGHHLMVDSAIYALRTKVRDLVTTPISRRAHRDPDEYFCECLVAYTFFRSRLMQHDPAGHTLMEEVFAHLRG